MESSDLANLGPLLFSACPSVRVCGHSNLVIHMYFIGFLPNIIYGMLPLTLAQAGIWGLGTNNMADKMAAACRFALVDTILSSLTQGGTNTFE